MSEDGEGAAKSFLYLVLRCAVAMLLGIVGFKAIYGGINAVDQSRSLQQQAEISLNEALEQNQPLPVGEYVSFDVRWVFDSYATNTRTRTYGDNEDKPLAKSETVEYYYLILADDLTLMSVATVNEEEIRALNSLTEQTISQILAGGLSEEGDSFLLQGKLIEMDNPEWKSIYEETLEDYGLFVPEMVRYLVLNTGYGREHVYYKLFGALGVIVVIAVVYWKIREGRKHPRKKGPYTAKKVNQKAVNFREAFGEENKL